MINGHGHGKRAAATRNYGTVAFLGETALSFFVLFLFNGGVAFFCSARSMYMKYPNDGGRYDKHAAQ